MSKHSTRKNESVKSAKQSRRRILFLIVVAAIVAITPIVVISRQHRAALSNRSANTTTTSAASAAKSRTYVTRRIGGQDVQIDSQSGEIKPLTPEEAQKLAEGLAPMLDQSTDGLPQVSHADGSVSMDISGRFQNVAVARVNQDGTVSQSCVDNPGAAGKFFGIDSKKIENARTARKRQNPE